MPKINPRIKSIDDLLGLDAAEESPIEPTPSVSLPTKNTIITLPPQAIRAFRGHPFRLYEGDRLNDLVESISEHGVLNPAIIRKIERDEDGFEYEMLAGHNRQNAAAIANRELPCIVKENLSDEDAWIYVIETNVLQRSFSEMLPSEKAAVLALRYSKMICQGRRNDIIEELKRLENPDEIRENPTSGTQCHRTKSRDILGAEYDLKGRAVANYLRINELITPLKRRIDDAEFPIVVAVQLSYLTEQEQKMVDDVLDKSYMRFLLHYNFPPFSTGEAKAQRGVGRREIGHGHLAWRALKGQIPANYPYTVRVVSDILESNGSSSMATVCAGTLALMDAGVPIKAPVSGIAMGLIKNPGEEKYAVLSDILGDEDHLGDMDFKTTGTAKGLTATQMDIKCDGLSYEILEKALAQAKQAREHILGKILETMPAPRAELKPHVPRIEAFDIPKEFIGAVIGPGGKIIQGMQEDTGATITIEEADGVGKIQVSGPNKDSIDAAVAKIRAIVAIPEVGEVYDAKVVSIMPYGCFVEILPGKDGLLHISEIDWKRLETVEEAGIKEGDKIKVKLMEIDPKTGKYKLSHRVLMEKPEGYVERERRPRPERGERRGRRDDRHEGRGERPARQPRRYEHRNDEQAPKEFNDSLDHNNDVE